MYGVLRKAPDRLFCVLVVLRNKVTNGLIKLRMRIGLNEAKVTNSGFSGLCDLHLENRLSRNTTVLENCSNSNQQKHGFRIR